MQRGWGGLLAGAARAGVRVGSARLISCGNKAEGWRTLISTRFTRAVCTCEADALSQHLLIKMWLCSARAMGSHSGDRNLYLSRSDGVCVCVCVCVCLCVCVCVCVCVSMQMNYTFLSISMSGPSNVSVCNPHLSPVCASTRRMEGSNFQTPSVFNLPSSTVVILQRALTSTRSNLLKCARGDRT